MGLLNRRKHSRNPKVDEARLQMDLAVLKMREVFERVEQQVIKAKEEIGEGRAG